MHKRKILIADDDPSVLMLVKQCLVSEGYEVITAKDGNEGFSKVKHAKPDLVILDVLMMGMDGYAVAEEIRKLESPLGEVPIIILSGKEGLEILFENFEISYFIPKPFDPHDLASKVENALQTAEQKKKLRENTGSGEMPFHPDSL